MRINLEPFCYHSCYLIINRALERDNHRDFDISDAKTWRGRT